MDKLSFNVNNYVYVKLNENGIAKLEKDWRDLKERFPTVYGEFTLNVDEQGYTKFQMWDFMHKFGDMMFLGGKMPFDSKILFRKWDLKDDN